MIHIESKVALPSDVRIDRLERAALAVLKIQGADEDVTLVLADDDQLQQLNRDFLGKDAPTDVLSFPASETDPESGHRYLGDVIISVPCAGRQAQAAGHDLEAELLLLVVHGVLHLLGHDHAEVDDKARMWTVQSEVLEGFGLAHIQDPT